jgi:hypothetical protein
MRVYWQQLGDHIHMRVFIRGARMGDLCCRDNEFDTVRAAMIGFDFRRDFREPFDDQERGSDHEG